ncbi:hypothetical protein B0H14DRAFT_3865227 [Mycena olivaceomarginata]|nr:hypothetical protein B0H14DRAFT_3865227 [Mycena olivaceomarginata]
MGHYALTNPLTPIVPVIRRTRAPIHADTYAPAQPFTIPLVSSRTGTPAQGTIQLRLGFVAPPPPTAHAPNQAQRRAGGRWGGALDGIFDASDRNEVLVWWNDIEKDSRSAQWSPSIHCVLRPPLLLLADMQRRVQILCPLRAGQFNIRLNVFNAVLVLDLSLSRPAALYTLTGAVANIVAQGMPFRLGVVPLEETEEGAKIAKLFYHSMRNYGRRWTMEFLKAVCVLVAPRPALSPSAPPPMSIYVPSLPLCASSPDDMSRIYPSLTHSLHYVLATSFIPAGPEPRLDCDASIRPSRQNCAAEAGTSADTGISLAQTLERGCSCVERLGTGLAASPTGHGFVNGKHFDMDDNFGGAIAPSISKKRSIVARSQRDHRQDQYFYDLHTSSLCRNRYIFLAPGDLRIVSLPELFSRTRFRVFPAPQLGCPPNASI